jgi:general secretion pathway protein A
MYESYYGFRERPFDLTPNPRYLVLTPAHREALSTLEYAIASRKGVTVLIGEAGSGKTTVIRAALERQPSRVHYVHLHNPALTRAEFVEMLAARFDLSDRAHASKTTLLLELESLLQARNAADETTVLVIDEAQSLSLDLLEEIRLLANIETSEHKLLSVVIAGQPELADRLNERALRQLKQRIALRCELRTLTADETAAYIAGRIRAAGGVGAQTFTREAVALIHESARGIPRAINVLADNALLTAFAAGQSLVTIDVVREVCRDFDFGFDTEAAAAPATAASVASTAAGRPGGPPDGAAILVMTRDGGVVHTAAATVPPPAPPPRTLRKSMFGAFLSKRRRFPSFLLRPETHE